MTEAAWALLGAVTGVLLTLMVTYIRNTCTQRTLVKEWRGHLQDLIDDLNEAETRLQRADNTHVGLVTAMEIHTLSIHANMAMLFLASHGVKGLHLKGLHDLPPEG